MSNRLIRRTLRKTDLENAYSLSVSDLRTALNQAYKDYKQARSQAEQLRYEFLPSLAEAHAKRLGIDPMHELQRLERIEDQ